MTAAHTIASLFDRMESIPPIDWTSVETAYPSVTYALDFIAHDCDLLTQLVHNAWRDTNLRKKCEIHSLDAKIVLWDNPDKGQRVRLRLAHTEQYERVHNHRFSFGAKVLSGSYFHNLYDTSAPLDESARVSDFRIVSSRVEPTGATICIDHTQLHTTLTPPETISLMIQSPAKKRRAFIIRLSDGDVWWRLGQADESADRRREVAMDEATYLGWVSKLAQLGLIAETVR